MRKLYYLAVLVVFILCKEKIVVNCLNALTLWTNNLFPLLFPTFVLADLLLSSDIPNFITNKFGALYERLFKTNRYGLFIFITSIISGTPTNAKMLLELKSSVGLSDEEITKILSHSLLFNPFLIVSFGGLNLLLIFWIANILTGIILRNYYSFDGKIDYKKIDYTFNLNDSISKNMSIMLNILGTITIFSALIAIIPFKNVYIRYFFISFLEVTNSLSFIRNFLNDNNIFYAFSFSIASFSIFMQIKSILKDTSINYKFLFFSRLICACIAELLIKCIFT